MTMSHTHMNMRIHVAKMRAGISAGIFYNKNADYGECARYLRGLSEFMGGGGEGYGIIRKRCVREQRS